VDPSLSPVGRFNQLLPDPTARYLSGFGWLSEKTLSKVVQLYIFNHQFQLQLAVLIGAISSSIWR
jgi:hypothetical protein